MKSVKPAILMLFLVFSAISMAVAVQAGGSAGVNRISTFFAGLPRKHHKKKNGKKAKKPKGAKVESLPKQ